MPPRLFTQAEANALLPALEPLLSNVREAYDEQAEAARHLEDLHIVHGEAVRDPAHADHGDWLEWAQRFRERAARLERMAAEVNARGCVLKDPGLGLVDFHAQRGGEVVFLCWRLGEPAVEHWHGLGEGFAGRRKVVHVRLPP